MVSLFLRNLFLTLLQPGIVAGAIPYYLLKSASFPAPADTTLQRTIGIVIGLLGLVLMFDCIYRFASEGKGTLSPADPTQKLVLRGMYRYSRNPMYLGVMGILLGEAIFWNHGWLWAYSAFIGLAFHTFIVFREERRLLHDFGDEYLRYCKKVRRWL